MKSDRNWQKGAGKGLAFIAIILIAGLCFLGAKIFSHEAPTIELTEQVKGIGKNSTIHFTVSDQEHPIKTVQVEVKQDGRVFAAPVSGVSSSASRPPRWKFWASDPVSREFTARIGHDALPNLKEGRAIIEITAANDSWGRFFRGGETQIERELPVRFQPPTIEVLTPQVYVNQAGCDMVLFKVSPGTTDSGIKAGPYFFRSWPVKKSSPQIRVCLFAFPYNLDPKTPAQVVARDDAGNQTVSGFSYKVFPKNFRTDTIQISDSFMQRTVPAIMSHTPMLQDQGSLLKDFLLVNGRLRKIDAQLLVAYSQKTSPRPLWTKPFLQLTNSKVEASFADFRTYVHNGQVIDHQTHLGFDLASVAHAPVIAANDGVVVFAQYFGIYGNAILIDHGLGLQSLYGHLSSFAVKAGDHVTRGEIIGHSGETGLAGGDHLHYSVLLDGIPVNPFEWWDPHWIHDRIEAKLEPYQ